MTRPGNPFSSADVRATVMLALMLMAATVVLAAQRQIVAAVAVGTAAVAVGAWSVKLWGIARR